MNVHWEEPLVYACWGKSVLFEEGSVGGGRVVAADIKF